MSGPDLTPPPDRDLPATEQGRAALVRELRPPRLRRRHVLLIPAGLLVTVGAAWAAGVFSTPVKDISTVVCQAEAKRGARSITLPTFLSGQVADSATEVCVAVPRVAKALGYVSAGRTRALVSCRGERQAVVVPGDDASEACQRLGLDPLSAQQFQTEVRRQIDAYRLVAALYPDPDDVNEQGPSEGPNCVLAGALRQRGQAVLRERGLEDFRVRLGEGGEASDCTSEVTVTVPTDGRTIHILTDASEDSPARDGARHTLSSEAGCRRLSRDGRLPNVGDMAVLIALECIDAELLIDRGRGLRPGETPQMLRVRLRLAGWRTTVNVPAGRGVAQFSSTSVDRRRKTIEVGFTLRRIVAPGPRSPAAE